jgi:hypothetical protein
LDGFGPDRFGVQIELLGRLVAQLIAPSDNGRLETFGFGFGLKG